MTISRVVLVVDDEVELRKLLSIQLRREGYAVHSAESGEKALELLRSGLHIDAIVSDIRMPGGMDGVELIKTMQRESIKLPVNILMSGHAILNPDEIKSLKINQCLSKPFSVKKLASVLHECLESADEETHPRKYPRLKTELAVVEGENSKSFTSDVSLGGLFIKMDYPFPVGTRFRVKMDLNKSIWVELEVKWRREKAIAHKPAGIGCQFINLSEEDEEHLRKFLESLTEGPTDLHDVFKRA